MDDVPRHEHRPAARLGPEPGRSIAERKAEVLQLVRELTPTVPPRAVAPPAALARLEVQRWREAFYRDAVADRLTSLCGLLEERLDALEAELMGAPPPLVAPDAPPAAPAAPAEAPAAPLAEAAPAEAAALSGRIQEGVLSDVLQMLSANLRTGRFVITGAEGTAELWYEDGEIRHAVAGELRGEAAFFAAIANQSGSFAFIEGGAPAPEHSINNKTQFLILEGLRKMDEESQGGEMPEHSP
jgi:hypothetical protein